MVAIYARLRQRRSLGVRAQREQAEERLDIRQPLCRSQSQPCEPAPRVLPRHTC